MSVHLKSLSRQVMVITGGSSGIGRTTAHMAVAAGAKVVLGARSEEALSKLCDELNQNGHNAAYQVCDVADESQVRQLAGKAIDEFGGIDTWVNGAGVSIYGELEKVTMEDHKRLFETNFWGVVIGSRVALEHLRLRGGALINIGSTLSDLSIPLQGMYSASKHAVKGFTDALRIEVKKTGAPVSVSLIKPAAVDTPYTIHATNYLSSLPQNPPPVYAPEVVARTILTCATKRVREVYVGGGGKMMGMMAHWAPRMMDRLMEKTMFAAQHSNRPDGGPREQGLHRPSGGGAQRGNYSGHVMRSSVYTQARLHPLATGLVAFGAGLAVAATVMLLKDQPSTGQKIKKRARQWSRRGMNAMAEGSQALRAGYQRMASQFL